MLGSGGSGISASSEIVARMGDILFGGLTSSTRRSRRDGRTQDGSRVRRRGLLFDELGFMKEFILYGRRKGRRAKSNYLSLTITLKIFHFYLLYRLFD